MADVPAPPPPPVAIRITRPYATEDEYLDEELDTLTRTSITLLGVQPRPQGVVLRFELVLSSGQVLARGEGRVIGFKHNAHEGLGGVTLRFTRLDSRTKTLVDKAAALREQRRPSARPNDSPPEAIATAPVPVAGAPRDGGGGHIPEEPSDPLMMTPIAIASEPSLPSLPDPPAPAPRPPVAPSPAATGPGAASPHADRDALLERLRARSKRLDPGALQVILASRRRV
ncbi:MAG TPA: hypothetical protein VH137_03490 [Gemmatimonadales bacterium]|nr:hypothetical protein [Gemmatimonadales bacterium]